MADIVRKRATSWQAEEQHRLETDATRTSPEGCPSCFNLAAPNPEHPSRFDRQAVAICATSSITEGAPPKKRPRPKASSTESTNSSRSCRSEPPDCVNARAPATLLAAVGLPAGLRHSALADNPDLDYDNAAEVRLLLETLPGGA